MQSREEFRELGPIPGNLRCDLNCNTVVHGPPITNCLNHSRVTWHTGGRAWRAGGKCSRRLFRHDEVVGWRTWQRETAGFKIVLALQPFICNEEGPRYKGDSRKRLAR